MGERIPEQVSRDSQQKRKQDQQKPRRAAEAEIAKIRLQPAFNAFGQEPGHCGFYEAMEEPQDGERERKG